MPIPDYQTLMLPLLRQVAHGETLKFNDVVETLADEFELTDEERTELLPSGTQQVFKNRVGWAKSYMKQAGLLEFPKRGFFKITQRGLDVLDAKPTSIDNDTLAQFEEFREFKNRKRETNDVGADTTGSAAESPEDQMASAYRRYQSEIENELLSLVKQVNPSFFEQIVVDLLVAMGYGGNRQDAARAVGKSGDEGIDGIIKEDRLGLDVIYIQAKRWDATIGRPELQKFAGALQGKRAKKGVFISTSSFTKEAIDYVDNIDSKIILIDGTKLAQLMIEFNVGTSSVGQYQLKQVDTDYFDQ